MEWWTTTNRWQPWCWRWIRLMKLAHHRCCKSTSLVIVLRCRCLPRRSVRLGLLEEGGLRSLWWLCHHVMEIFQGLLGQLGAMRGRLQLCVARHASCGTCIEVSSPSDFSVNHWRFHLEIYHWNPLGGACDWLRWSSCCGPELRNMPCRGCQRQLVLHLQWGRIRTQLSVWSDCQ